MNTRTLTLTLAFLSLLVLLTTGINAQPGPGGMRGNRAEMMINTLRDTLDLSEEQLGKVKEIVTTGFEQMARAREDAQGDREMMMQSMREINQSMDEQIEALLNDPQKVKYQEYREQRAQRMRERMQNRGGQ